MKKLFATLTLIGALSAPITAHACPLILSETSIVDEVVLYADDFNNEQAWIFIQALPLDLIKYMYDNDMYIYATNTEIFVLER